MNKFEFLCALRANLKRLPAEEIESAITYYDEYISDAGAENEQKVLSELGSPAAVASKIIGEYAINNVQEQKEKKTSNVIWITILAIFASPIALPLAIAAVVVIFSLIIALFSILFSFAAASVSLIAGGIAAIVFAFVALFSSPATAMFMAGGGMVCACLGIAFIIGTIKLTKVSILGIQKMIGKFLIRRGSK